MIVINNLGDPKNPLINLVVGAALVLPWLRKSVGCSIVAPPYVVTRWISEGSGRQSQYQRQKGCRKQTSHPYIIYSTTVLLSGHTIQPLNVRKYN